MTLRHRHTSGRSAKLTELQEQLAATSFTPEAETAKIANVLHKLLELLKKSPRALSRF